MDTVYTALVFPLLLLIGQTLVALGQRKISQRMDEGQAKTDEKRAKEAEWRDSIDKRLTDIEDKQDRSIAAQAAQTRSDIVHKCHRYLDDLGRASTEEKQALKEEHEQYAQFCEDLDLENNFIDIMVQRVMELPEREV